MDFLNRSIYSLCLILTESHGKSYIFGSLGLEQLKFQMRSEHLPKKHHLFGCSIVVYFV